MPKAGIRENLKIMRSHPSADLLVTSQYMSKQRGKHFHGRAEVRTTSSILAVNGTRELEIKYLKDCIIAVKTVFIVCVFFADGQ
jgi:hypothetical protein